MTNVQTPSQHSPGATGQVKTGSSTSPLSERWVELIFEKMAALYGARFADLWRNCDGEGVKATWGRALAGFTGEELRRGLDACMSRPFPPTLPEFRLLCRPSVDFEATFAEAAVQMQLRETGGDHWSHPAVYWAAVRIGSFDLRNGTWPSMKARWTAALQAELAKGSWPPVPARREALPAPGKTMTREKGQAACRDLLDGLLRKKVA